MDNLKGLHISSMDDDDSGAEEQSDDSSINGDEGELLTLGFVKKAENSWSLLRHLFPSKAGGVPAWLDPVNLPSGRACACDICGEPLQFLLQVYAPIVEKDFAFHRTLFVFMCPSMNCLRRDQHEQWKRLPEKASRSVKVFRCQLPRTNPFYSSEAPRHDGTDRPSGSGATLCNWCGTWKGDKVCSNCRRAWYCSAKHQVKHWHSGHKTGCQALNITSESSDSIPNGSSQAISVDIQKGSRNYSWPEYEIIHEDESEFEEEISECTSHSRSLVSMERMDETMDSLLDKYEGDDDKKTWVSFQQRIAKAPEQVLRYCRCSRAKPLWPMFGGWPSKADIPSCSFCGGPMCFEFQILPQLLYYFGVKNEVDSLDWATIVVYACEASCEASLAYREEFAWVQLSSPSSTH